MPPVDDSLPDADRLWDQAACGLLLTDANGLVLRANATFCGWIGVEAAALVGQRRLQDLMTVGARIFHQTHWAPLLQLQGSVAEVKLDLAGPGGKPLPVVMNARRYGHAGRMLHDIALFVASDRHAYERGLLAARRRAETLAVEQREAREALLLAEARFRLALDAGDLHYYEADPHTGERFLGDDFATLLGLPPQPITTQRYHAAIVADDAAAAIAAFEGLRRDPSRGFRVVYRLRGEDGRTRVVQSIARAVHDAAGGVERIVGIAQDITELAARRDAAEDRALLAEQLVGIVSHDLRTPLSTIAMGSEALLLLGSADARVGEVASRIRRSAARARRLADDLLDFTRARLGRGVDVRPAPIDLHRVVAEQLDDLRSAHPGRAIEHEAQGTGTAVADANRLAQLLGNLVGNALAYGDGVSPVTVHSRVDADGWALAVHNHGEPIDPATLPKLFLPMVRGDDRTGSSSVGLGLYIVDRIVAAHGGSIGVTSETHGGTTFTASFPAPATAGASPGER